MYISFSFCDCYQKHFFVHDKRDSNQIQKRNSEAAFVTDLIPSSGGS